MFKDASKDENHRLRSFSLPKRALWAEFDIKLTESIKNSSFRRELSLKRLQRLLTMKTKTKTKARQP
jgi:hypothetical protein